VPALRVDSNAEAGGRLRDEAASRADEVGGPQAEAAEGAHDEVSVAEALVAGEDAARVTRRDDRPQGRAAA
jgi:hypothetical protein